MKDTISDANFPKTGDGRVYHLGLKAGEVANRIITVGDPARARIIGKYLDKKATSAVQTNGDTTSNDDKVQAFALHSERGFLTITGTYNGVPVSIVAIGMGAPNMDFFVRECREIIEGEIVIVRFGSCGGLVDALPVGSLTVPKASMSVSRNYDYDFSRPPSKEAFLSAYHHSKPVPADPLLHQAVATSLRQALPKTVISSVFLNSSGDSFYSSQGRTTSFPDHNAGVVDYMVEKGVGSLEMETFHLFHLASCWKSTKASDSSELSQNPPLTSPPADATTSSISLTPSSSDPDIATQRETTSTVSASNTQGPCIRAAAVQMIFAERGSRAFIAPEEVTALQNGASKGILEAITSFPIHDELLHPRVGAVWN